MTGPTPGEESVSAESSLVVRSGREGCGPAPSGTGWGLVVRLGNYHASVIPRLLGLAVNLYYSTVYQVQLALFRSKRCSHYSGTTSCTTIPPVFVYAQPLLG